MTSASSRSPVTNACATVTRSRHEPARVQARTTTATFQDHLVRSSERSCLPPLPKKEPMTKTLKAAEDKLTMLLLEQLQAYQDYALAQTGDNYDLILKLKKQVNKAKLEVARNK